MKRFALAALMLAAWAAPGDCAGYDVLNAAIEYSNSEAWENTIIWTGKAIDAGDLLPDQLRVAHYTRARALQKIGKPDEAIADYSAALVTTPDDLQLLTERAFAYVAAGRGDRAIADLKIAHERRPKNISINYEIGLVNWALDHHAEASDAFASSLKEGKSRYAWLWLKLSDLKQKKQTDFYHSPYYAIPWPDPLVKFYNGDKDEAEVFKSVQEYGDSENCDAVFYVAEWHLVHGDTAGAKPLLQKSVAECPKGEIEPQMAQVELSRLP